MDIRHFCAAALISLMLANICESAITVKWDETKVSADVSAINFNAATLFFPAFTTGELTQIDGGSYLGLSSAYFLDHSVSGGVQVEMDIRLDGNWTTIFSTQTFGDNARNYIDEISTPISFSIGVVDALRWISSPNANETFGRWTTIQVEQADPESSRAVSFTFADTQTAVPEPVSLAVWSLLGLTLGGLGWLGRRKR